MLGFKVINGLEKTAYYFFSVRGLHSSLDFAFAAANLAANSFSRSLARHCQEKSVSGLKTGFLPVVTACSYSYNSSGDMKGMYFSISRMAWMYSKA